MTDLDKVADSVKRDNVIIQDLAQAIVMGTVPIEVSFWTSGPGILLIIISGILLAAGVVIAMLVIKLRNLAIAVAFLQCQPTFVRAQIILDYAKNQISKVSDDTNPYPGSLWIQITDNPSTTSFVAAVLLILAGLWLIKYGITTIRKKIRSTTITLALELVVKQKNLLIPLRQCRGIQTDYLIVVTDKTVTDVTIKGIYSPKLSITADGTALVDFMAGRRFLLRGSYKISCITAMWAKCMLKEPHAFRLVWINNDKDITHATVAKRTTINEDRLTSQLTTITQPVQV